MSENGPIVQVNVPWDEFAILFLAKPVIFIAFGYCVCHVLHSTYPRMVQKSTFLQVLHEDFIGSASTEQVAHPEMLVVLYVVQFIGSMWTVFIFLERSYTYDSSPYTVESIFYPCFLFNALVSLLQNEFNPNLMLDLGMVTDAFTVIPYYFNGVPDANNQFRTDADPGTMTMFTEYATWLVKQSVSFDGKTATGMWVTVNYLRARQSSMAWDRLYTRVISEDAKAGKEFIFAVFSMAFKTFSLMLGWSGLIFTLEILGEPEYFSSWGRIETGMGALSYMQMFYWIMTTISTVGYGDYSPVTTMSRLTTMYIIGAGVIFFGSATKELVKLQDFLDSGNGRYRSKGKGRHVVITGLGVNGGTNFLLPTFIQEVFHRDHLKEMVGSSVLPDWFPKFLKTWLRYLTPGRGHRDVVFLVESGLDREFREFVMQNIDTKMRSNVYFFEGDVQDEKDCERVALTHAYMVFIVPGAYRMKMKPVAEQEDHDLQNTMRAMSVRRNAEAVKMRLCILTSNKKKAESFGIDPLNILSIGEIQASLIAASVRVWGCVAMLCGYMFSLHDRDVEKMEESNDKNPTLGPVVQEFLRGCNHQLYGLKLHKMYAGRRFRDVAKNVMLKSGILMLGVQVNGTVILNPPIKLQKNAIVFCLAPDRASVEFLEAGTGAPWDVDFVKSRRNAESASHAIGEATQEDLPLFENHMAANGEMTQRPILDAAVVSKNKDLIIQANISAASASTSDTDRSSDDEHVDMASADTSAQNVPEYSEPAELKIAFIVVGDKSWSDLVWIISRIQRDTVFRTVRTIVMSEVEAPPLVLKALLEKKCRVLVGNTESVNKLMQAGVMESDCIVTVNGADSDSQLLSRLCTIKKLQVHSYDEGCYIIGELKDGISSLDVLTYVSRYHYIARATRRRILDIPVDTYFLKAGDHLQGLGEKLITHEECLAGQIVMADMFGYLLARMCYLPATIELLYLLLQPARGQACIMVQCRVPPDFIGKPYKTLLTQWMSSAECILPLAMFREAEVPLPNGETMTQMYCAGMPKFNTILREKDYCTVIAPRPWCAKMSKKRLLRCTKMASSVFKRGAANLSNPEFEGGGMAGSHGVT